MVPGDDERSCTGVCELARLDRLLVERRADVAGSTTGRGRDAQVPVRRLLVDQPAQEPQPLVERGAVAQRVAGGDEGLGQQGVAVRQARLRPGPALVVRSSGERRQPVLDQRSSRQAALVGREELRRTDHRVRGRPRMVRAEPGDQLEETPRLTANMGPGRHRRGDTDTEDRATARVVGRRVVRPSPVEPHPETEPVLALVGLHEEREPPLRQLLRTGFERSNGDREAASGVVGAVAERPMGQRADRMLEQAGVVRHALQVSERRLRRGHAAASRSANTRCASRKYSEPIAGHARRSASRSA